MIPKPLHSKDNRPNSNFEIWFSKLNFSNCLKKIHLSYQTENIVPAMHNFSFYKVSLVHESQYAIFIKCECMKYMPG